MKHLYYAGMVFLGGCCYGILSTFVKIAYRSGFSPNTVTGAQYLFGTVLAWFVLLFVKKKPISKRTIFQLLASGIPFGLTGTFYYQSLQTLNASLAIILLFQSVWIGSLIAWLVYKKKPTKMKLFSLVVLVLGSLMAANVFSNGGATLSFQGVIWGGLAATSFATFIFLSGIVGNTLPAIQKSALLSAGALLTVSLIYPPVFLFDAETVIGILPIGLLLGFFGVLFPPFLYSIGMPKVGPSLGTILTSSELPTAVLLSSFVLKEKVNLLQFAGVLLIILAIIWSSLKEEKSQTENRAH
ncbi:multidrug DMT transporter permease [Enterococcus sp. JM4C]|uniref:EamA family transporter n=1 Tax=Candidatus Enterococcus huntleyi TaxID=1857217 RepID=UPI00137957DD|nr:DMT family transporter [Enterococcus sp. JM4C]KAF1296960.1 multidrug DMT transporter permease [Enterococcus sp. JM4C]